MTALVISIACVLLSLIAVILAARAAIAAENAAQWCAENNKKAKITALEAQMVELDDSLDSVRESLKKLRSRAGMRELRDRRKKGADRASHDLNTQEGRDAARIELEAELASAGKLNPRIHVGGSN